MNKTNNNCKLHNYVGNTICQTYDILATEDSNVLYINCEGCIQKESILKNENRTLCSKVIPWGKNIELTNFVFADNECIENTNIPLTFKVTIAQYTYDGLDVTISTLDNSFIDTISLSGGINEATATNNLSIDSSIKYKTLLIDITPGLLEFSNFLTVKIKKDGTESFLLKNYKSSLSNKKIYLRTNNHKINNLEINISYNSLNV